MSLSPEGHEPFQLRGVLGSEATKVRKVSQRRIGLSYVLMNIEITRYVSSPNTNDKVPDWEELKISQSLYTQCLDDILWEFTYLCCFRPFVRRRPIDLCARV
jgi:hypothetical protein